MLLTYNPNRSNNFIVLKEIKGNSVDFIELGQLQKACITGFFYILQLLNPKADEYIVCNEGWTVPLNNIIIH